MVSMPAISSCALQESFEAQYRSIDAFSCQVNLVHDVVEVVVLAQINALTRVEVDAFDGSCVDASLVHSALLWRLSDKARVGR
jgi:hypothetical protein